MRWLRAGRDRGRVARFSFLPLLQDSLQLIRSEAGVASGMRVPLFGGQVKIFARFSINVFDGDLDFLLFKDFRDCCKVPVELFLVTPFLNC